MAEENGAVLSNVPAWLKAIAQVGWPIVVGSVLMYYVLFVQGAQLTTMNVTLSAHASDTVELRKDMSAFLLHHEQEINMMRSVLQQICANGAKTTADRERCFPLPGVR